MLIWGKRGQQGTPSCRLSGSAWELAHPEKKVPLEWGTLVPAGFGGSGWVVAWELEVWLALVLLLISYTIIGKKIGFLWLSFYVQKMEYWPRRPQWMAGSLKQVQEI